MRKSDLHPELQASCIAIPGRSGCYAVVPPPAPSSVRVPQADALFALARREMEHLTSVIAQNRDFSDLVFHMLNRREAVDSSQIEGTHTGFDGLLIHELEAGTAEARQDDDANATFAYVHAFQEGCRQVDALGKEALTLGLIQELHRVLMGAQERVNPGEWRTVQNYIGIRLETATYVPPPVSELQRLMNDLQGLLGYDPDGMMHVSILMRAAIAHVQFEAIHPFLDGNGRVGRLLLPLMFKAEGAPPIHLATFLKVRRREYYEALLEVQTRKNWAPWIRVFLECVVASCRHTIQLFDGLQRIQASWTTRIAATGRRRHATIWRVADMLLGQPLVTANKVSERLAVSFPAANDAIADLVDLDILRPSNDQRRHRVFQAHEVTNALYTGLDGVLEDVARLTEPQ